MNKHIGNGLQAYITINHKVCTLIKVDIKYIPLVWYKYNG